MRFAQKIIHITHIKVYYVISFCPCTACRSLLDQVKEKENMIRQTRLFTPGPTPLLPAAQFAMAAADIHHRTPEFRALFLKVLAAGRNIAQLA